MKSSFLVGYAATVWVKYGPSNNLPRFHVVSVCLDGNQPAVFDQNFCRFASFLSHAFLIGGGLSMYRAKKLGLLSSFVAMVLIPGRWFVRMFGAVLIQVDRNVVGVGVVGVGVVGVDCDRFVVVLNGIGTRAIGI